MWQNKDKSTAQTPSLKTKINTNKFRGRILTPDGNQILVGSPENLILIFQGDATEWINKTKTLLV